MKKLILDTDWWSDCDDAVAVKLLANLHKRKETELIGICINACMEHSAASLGAFMADCGIEDIPVALDRTADSYPGETRYQEYLAKLGTGRLNSNADAEEPVKFYRRLLSMSDGKTDIAEIGFCQVLAALLESGPDEYSPLCGKDLVREKVGKLWIMAGKWDDTEHGREHNFALTDKTVLSGAKVCKEWPTPVTFLGWEAGYSVISGGTLGKETLLCKILELYGTPDGRCSWDPMLCLMACIGDEETAGYAVKRGKASLDTRNGENHFDFSEDGDHCFVVKVHPDEYYAHMIDEIINVD